MSETLLTRFRFSVQIDPSGQGGDEGLTDGEGAFSEVSGLEMSIEMTTFREGGYHAGSRQLAGKTTTVPLILKRGVSLDDAFWKWILRCVDGTYPLPYVTGSIHVQPPDGPESGDEAVWTFVNGIVTKVKSADLNAVEARDVGIEELHIVHEGLRRRGRP